MFREFIRDKFQTAIQYCNILKKQIISSKRTVIKICIYTVLFSLFLTLLKNFFPDILVEVFTAIEFRKLNIAVVSVETCPFSYFAIIICMLVLLFIAFFKLVNLKRKNISLRYIKRKVVIDVSMINAIIIQLIFCIYSKKSYIILLVLGMYTILDLFPILFRTGKSRKESRKLRYNSTFFKVLYFLVLATIFDVLITYYSSLNDYLDLLIKDFPIGHISADSVLGIINVIVNLVFVIMNSKKNGESKFCGIPMNDLGYCNTHIQDSSITMYVIIVFMVIEIFAVLCKLIIPVACIIISIIFIGIVFVTADNLSMEDKADIFKSSINQEIAEFQENNGLDNRSTYFQRVLIYNYKYRKNESMIDSIEEIKYAYDMVVQCILENINSISEDQQCTFLSNWDYIKYSIKCFIDTIILEGKKKEESIKLSVDIVCTFIKKGLNVEKYNKFILFQIASVVKVIYDSTNDLNFALLFCDEFTDRNTHKVSCLYFLLIIYLYNICYINDDYDHKKVKKDLDLIFKKIHDLQNKDINNQQIGHLDAIFVASVKEYDSAHRIILKIRNLEKINSESTFDLIRKIVCEREMH